MRNFFIILLFIPFTLTGQRYVSGRVTEAENKNNPVVGASVFISTTTIGDFTDADGFYKLSIPEEGSYQLIISHTGYKFVSKDIEPGNKSVVFNAALQINELQEVTITKKVSFRQKDINLFWNTILGTNPSTKTIQVINPKNVYYYYNSETRILKVTCREPLEIINHKTGYHIRYILDYFTHDYNKELSDWSYKSNFTELKPESAKQMNNWKKERRKVYDISLVKFIKSLYNNSLYNDGFVLATLRQNTSQSNSQSDREALGPNLGPFIGPNTKTKSRSNDTYEISLLQPEEILSINSADNKKTLNFTNKQIILICYGRPVTSDDLGFIRNAQGEGFNKNNGLFMNQLVGDLIRIFPDGTYANKLLMSPVNFSNTLLGLNTKLPIEYIPEKLEIPVMENENIFDFNNIAEHFDTQINLFPQENIHLHTDRNLYIPGETIWFKAYLTDAVTLHPSANSRYVYVELINSRDSLVNRIMIRPENDMYYGYLSITENAPEGNYTIRAYTRNMENLGDDYFFKKNIRIENPASYKKQIYQQGQKNDRAKTLVNDFKVDNHAYSLTVSRQNNMVTVEVLKPDNNPDIPLYLLAQCRGQVFYFSDLQGMADQVGHDKEDIGMADQVRHDKGDMGMADQVRHDKGDIGMADQVRHDRGDMGMADQVGDEINFPEDELPEGILHFTLFDEKMNPLSERLVFNKNYDNVKVEFKTNSETYKPRELVVSSLSIVDSDGKPLTSDLSVAITDDNDIDVDSTSTIQSSLLLSSELKGYIENPAYYLRDNSESAIALDKLMQTQKWRRYNISDVVKGSYASPKFPVQTSQEIFGMVQGARSKPVVDSEIMIMANGSVFGMTSTDNKGTFVFKDFEFPDSTSYYIKTFGKSGGSGKKLVLNMESFPSPIHAPQSPFVEIPVVQENTKNEPDPNTFVTKAEQRLKYGENTRMINLSEVVITAQNKEEKEEPRLQFYANKGSDVTIRREDFIKMRPRKVSDILRGVAGVQVTSDGSIIIGGQLSLNLPTQPLVLIDGMPIDWENWIKYEDPLYSPLELVSVHDVASIDVFKGGSAAIFGVRAVGGAISITTRKGTDDITEIDNSRDKKTLNSTIYTPMGYQSPVDFYSPEYETTEAKKSIIPDYRTTIFWKPDIVISNTGEASFKFYTSDVPTTYSVVIEGLTDDGRIIRHVEKIRVE